MKMIKIRRNFIQDVDGKWYNLDHIFVIRIRIIENQEKSYYTMIETVENYATIAIHHKLVDAQEQLDAMMDLLDYGIEV